MDDLPQFIIVVTLVQLWFIAIWGLGDMAIRWLTGHSRMLEAGIYVAIIISVLAYVYYNPIYRHLFSGV